MSEPDDCLTQLEDAIRAAVEAGCPLVKRVLGPEDLPVKDGHLPAVVIDLGDEIPTTLGVEEGGERVQQRRLQVDVLVVLDTALRDFKRQSRAVANQVRTTLSGPRPVDLPLDAFGLVGVKPQSFASEKGNQGGYHLAFEVTFLSGEATPDRFIPLNETSELI